jgi:hypothetical protein
VPYLMMCLAYGCRSLTGAIILILVLMMMMMMMMMMMVMILIAHLSSLPTWGMKSSGCEPNTSSSVPIRSYENT